MIAGRFTESSRLGPRRFFWLEDRARTPMVPDSPTRPAATAYTFITVLDSQRDGLEATRCAAINTLGTVAVTVRDTCSAAPASSPSGARTMRRWSSRTPQSAADFPTFCDNGFSSLPSDPSINEKGEVAFQGNLRRLTTRADCGTAEQRQRRQGVFLGKGGPLTTIAHTINPPGGDFIAEFLVADQSVNTLGRVAFVPELDETFEQGLFVGSKSGTFDQRFLSDTPTPDGFNFNNISSRVSLNEVGQIAFESGLNDTFVSGIFLSNPNGTFRTIVDNTGALSLGRRPVAEHLRPRGVHRRALRRGLQSDLQHQHEPGRAR